MLILTFLSAHLSAASNALLNRFEKTAHWSNCLYDISFPGICQEFQEHFSFLYRNFFLRQGVSCAGITSHCEMGVYQVIFLKFLSSSSTKSNTPIKVAVKNGKLSNLSDEYLTWLCFLKIQRITFFTYSY